MSKPRKLSEEAAAAETPAEMWSLFFDKKEGVVLFSYFILLFSKIFAIQIY